MDSSAPLAPRPSRRLALRLGAGSALMTLAGCSGIDLGNQSGGRPYSGPDGEPGPGGPAANGARIGNGSVKIALLLPLSASGNAGPAATALRNAVELALAEFSGADVTVLVKDDRGTADGARAAASEAFQEGAELILGPLFAPAVQAAGAVARQAGKPVIAFSTDASVATRGVYLLSFLPQNDVSRILSYAASQGKRSYAAFVPDNAYGQVVQGAFQETAAASGARVMGMEKFGTSPAAMNDAAKRLSAIASQIDAIFVPDPADGMAINALKAAGVDPARVQVLGAGPWEGNSGAAQAAPTALYATADSAGFRAFSGRYQAKFGQSPVRIASLSYDATMLVAALARTQGGARFAEGTLTNASGFNGVDGLFRFRPDGTCQRGLAVLKAGGTVVSPAPKTFAS